MGSTWSREVVEADYLSGNAGRDRHCALATYFTGQALDRTTNDPLHPNLRKLAELPYQQTLGELWDDLFATLTDFTFLERKAAELGVVEYKDAKGITTRAYTGTMRLEEDFRLALIYPK